MKIDFKSPAAHGGLVREVYSSQDFTQVGYYKSLLDEAGISSFIQNENANSIGLAGAVFFPSLCVMDDSDYDEAVHILKSHQNNNSISADWTCPACSEINPGNFELCWRCSAPRPGA